MPRVLVVADVHANGPALEAVLAAEPERDSVCFLGDAVDAGPHPEAVCERLRDLDALTGVRGNHDRTVLDAADPDALDDTPHADWQRWTYDRLSAESRSFLESLDLTTTFSVGDETFRLHHGDFPAPDGYDDEWRTRTTPDDDSAVFEALTDRYDEDVVLHGHSHYPFEATVGGTTFLNPGSVGLQRAGWPLDRARYAVWENGSFDLRAVTYDTSSVSADSRSLASPYRDLWGRPEPTGE